MHVYNTVPTIAYILHTNKQTVHVHAMTQPRLFWIVFYTSLFVQLEVFALGKNLTGFDRLSNSVYTTVVIAQSVILLSKGLCLGV